MSYGVDKNTLLLIHGTEIADASQYGRILTNAGAQIVEMSGSLNDRVLYFDGASKINLPIGDYFRFGEGDFTIDWREYIPGIFPTPGNPFTFDKDPEHFLWHYYRDDSAIQLYYTTTYVGTVISTVKTGRWVHRAFVRHGSALYAFEDGTLVWSGAISGSAPYTEGYQMCVGGRSEQTQNQYFYGYMEEFRVSDVARWTSDFVPPSLAAGVPEGLTAVYTKGTVRLSWAAADNALGYRVYRNGVLFGDTKETSETSFTDPDADAEAYTAYTYTVSAYNEYGEGDGAALSVVIPGSENPLADLITDRMQWDVTNRTAKGVYNASDLNRVAEAVGYVRGMLDSCGYAVPQKPKSDWHANELPVQSAMQTHIDAVRGLDVIRYAETKITLPGTMEKLGYEGANAIEKFLTAVGEAAERIPYGWMYSGEIFGGEI